MLKNYRYILTLYKQFYLISVRRKMPNTKQIKNALPTVESNQEKQQMIIFFKSYMRYLKKVLECSSFESGSQSSIFDLKKTTGNVSFELFLQRVLSYFKCGAEAYICALCLIDRLMNSQSAKTEKITLSIRNIYKIISIAILISTKNFDDFYYTNTYYSRVCGLTLQQLNQLEKQFLEMIDFNVFVDSEQYESYASVINGYQKAYAAEAVAKETHSDKVNRNELRKRADMELRANYQTSKEQDSTNTEVEVLA